MLVPKKFHCPFSMFCKCQVGFSVIANLSGTRDIQKKTFTVQGLRNGVPHSVHILFYSRSRPHSVSVKKILAWPVQGNTHLAESRTVLSPTVTHGQAMIFDLLKEVLPKLKIQTKLLFLKALRVLCPISFDGSLEDFTHTTLLFPDFTLKNVIILICVYTFYLAFIFDGFFYFLVDTHFLLLPRSSLGHFMGPIHIVCGVGACEILVLRSYCLYARIKYGKHSITWFNVISSVEKKGHPKLFIVAKLFFLQMWSGLVLIYLGNHLAKLILERSTPIDYIVNAAWFVSEVALTRHMILELPVNLLMSYACYAQVNVNLDRLLVIFGESHLALDALIEYIRLVKSILHVHPLMKVVSLTSRITVIPYVSLIIIIAITPTENNGQLIIKCIYLLSGVLWSNRGIVMTSIVSKIESKSRVLHKCIASRIARGQVVGSISHSQLILIMEDLSSAKNHICMREYSGSRSDQMDILINVVVTGQIVMLLREFSVKLSL